MRVGKDDEYLGGGHRYNVCLAMLERMDGTKAYSEMRGAGDGKEIDNVRPIMRKNY